MLIPNLQAFKFQTKMTKGTLNLKRTFGTRKCIQTSSRNKLFFFLNQSIALNPKVEFSLSETIRMDLDVFRLFRFSVSFDAVAFSISRQEVR